MDRYKSLFQSYLLERRQSCETYYVECNRANRSSCDSQVGSSTDAGSSTSSVVSSMMVKGVSPKSVAKNVLRLLLLVSPRVSPADHLRRTVEEVLR